MFGIITAFNLMDWLIDKESWKNLFCKLSATVFLFMQPTKYTSLTGQRASSPVLLLQTPEED